ncbi:MAG: tyrosine-type recombinase/integrase [Firmicutes bacterium]|nr:tyrosine-type recombinase/integrase [Bacillota bacterium]
MSFQRERDNAARERADKILADLPHVCTEFVLAISARSTSLTILNYVYDLRAFFIFLQMKFPEIGHLDMNQIGVEQLELLTAHDIELYLHDLTRTNGDRGRARKLSALRSFFAFMYKRDMITKNELTRVDMPKIRTRAIVKLETPEVREILDRPLTLRDATILQMFLGTGIRVSELVGLNVDDIDLKNKSFKIIRKGGAEAILYLSDDLATQLLGYMDSIGVSPKTHRGVALFGGMGTDRIGIRAVQKLVKKYALAAVPLKNISPHKLRSTYGTALYRETGDIYLVADVLGHRDVNTTTKHYAQIADDRRRDAADVPIYKSPKKD